MRNEVFNIDTIPLRSQGSSIRSKTGAAKADKKRQRTCRNLPPFVTACDGDFAAICRHLPLFVALKPTRTLMPVRSQEPLTLPPGERTSGQPSLDPVLAIVESGL